MNEPEVSAAGELASAYYATNYRDYQKQNPPRKLLYYAELVERHVAPDAPRRIHDLGCGFGKFLSGLAEDWEVCGSDPNRFAIGMAEKEVPRGSFRVGSATDGAAGTEPVFPGRFGVVTALDALEHVADLDAAAAAVKRQLAKRGLFLFVVPVYDGLCGPIIRFLDRDPTHVHKWPRRRWIEWAGDHFELLQWSGTFRYLLPMFGYYTHLSTKRFRNHAPAITVVCRKKES